MTSHKPPKPGITLQSASDTSKYRFEDSYKLIKKLSKGSFGIVFSSEHIDTHEEFAVKVIERKELNQKETNSVEREVSILRDFRDVLHIVQLVDFYVSPERYYVVQQLAQGGDVFERLAQRTSYNEKDARDLAVHLLQAIDVLHSRKLAHRDLKPENLLLRELFDDTAILVADFGFAAYVPPEGLKTRCGTPAFVAPQILVPDCRYDERVDMWSVGCLLYMLIAGYPPFQDRNHRGLFRKVRGADFVFHDKYWKNVSKSAKQLISCMLTIDPRYRCTARMALEKSNWLKMDASLLIEHDLAASLGEIKKFHARRTLKSAIHAVVWTVKYKNKSADDAMLEDKMKGLDLMMNAKNTKGQTPRQNSLDIFRPELESRNDDFDDEDLCERPGASDTLLLTKLRQSLSFSDIYEVTELLHDGQSSKVYECYHRKTRETLAVKIIDRNDSIKKSVSGRTLTETVLHEVALLDSLHHKNIIRIQEFFEDNDKFYLVMERMRGGDVFDRIMKETRYTEQDARTLAKVLLEAVAYFHEKGITHRDLKPQNLLIKTDNDLASIKVADFGFACRVHTPQSLTTRCGTPSYVAPEVLKNIPYDQSADMWSVGVILYLLLCGSPPFVDDNQSELFRKIRTSEWKFRGEIWNNVSKDAKDLVRRLLVPNPLQRITAAQALKCRWFRLKDNTIVGSKNVVSAAAAMDTKLVQQNIAKEPEWMDIADGLHAVEQVLTQKEAEEIKRIRDRIPPNTIRGRDELNGKIESSKILKTRSSGADDVNVRVSDKDDHKPAKVESIYDGRNLKKSESTEADNPALSLSSQAKAAVHRKTQIILNTDPEEGFAYPNLPSEKKPDSRLMKASHSQPAANGYHSPPRSQRVKANSNDLRRNVLAINPLQKGYQVSNGPANLDSVRLTGTKIDSRINVSDTENDLSRRAPRLTNVTLSVETQLETNTKAPANLTDNTLRHSQKKTPESNGISASSNRKSQSAAVQRVDGASETAGVNDSSLMQGNNQISVVGRKSLDIPQNNGMPVNKTAIDNISKPIHKQPESRQIILANDKNSLQGSKSLTNTAGLNPSDTVVRHMPKPRNEPSELRQPSQLNGAGAHTSTSVALDVKSSAKPHHESQEASSLSERQHRDGRPSIAVQGVIEQTTSVAPELRQANPNGNAKHLKTSEQPSAAANRKLAALHLTPPQSDRLRLRRLSRVSKVNGDVEAFERLEI